MINLNWEQWIRDSAVLFTENDERENFKIPDHFLPIIRRLYDAFLQPTILRGFVDLINHIAPTVYRCFCFLVDVFELDRQFYLGTSDLGIRMNYILSLYMDSSNDSNVAETDRIFFLQTRMIAKKILADFSDGTSYVRPFVIFRDCIQKVVQFTEPAVINYGLCVLKDFYYFMNVERPIINTSLVLDPPFRYHVTDPTCNRANVRCMDFLRKVSSFQFMYSERSKVDNRKAAAEIYYDYLGCKLEQRLIVAKKETIEEYRDRIQKGGNDISGVYSFSRKLLLVTYNNPFYLANMFEQLRLLVTLEMKVFHKSIYILQDEAMTETVDALVEDGSK